MRALCLKLSATFLTALIFLAGISAQAEVYQIDSAGSHGFIQLKIKHQGYS